MQNLKLIVKYGVLWLALSFAGATALRAEEPDEGIAAVIANLDAQKDQVEQLITEELSPQRQKIHEAFAETVKSLDGLIVQLRRNPKDAELRQKFDETMTAALGEAQTLLSDYSRLREPTKRKLATVDSALQQTRRACQREMNVVQEKRTEHSRQTQEIEQKLTALADKHRAVLTSSKGSLPPDVQLEIQLLDVDLQIAQQNAQFDALAQQDYERALGEIDTQIGELSHLRSSLEVTFRYAEGQVQLLSRIGDLRERRQQHSRLGAGIGTMVPLVDMAAARNTNVSELIDKFLNHDVAQPQQPKPSVRSVATRSSRRAEDIISRYLNPEQPKETKHVAN